MRAAVGDPINGLARELEATYRAVRTMPPGPKRTRALAAIVAQVKASIAADNLEPREELAGRMRRDIDELVAIVGLAEVKLNAKIIDSPELKGEAA